MKTHKRCKKKKLKKSKIIEKKEERKREEPRKRQKKSGYVHLYLGKVERGTNEINYKANKKGYEKEKKKKKNK